MIVKPEECRCCMEIDRCGDKMYEHEDPTYVLRWLPTVTVQLNIDQSLRYQNDLAFRFLMLKNSLKIMKTSFVFVNKEIRKQKLHKKCNLVRKSHAFLDFQICAGTQ